jgi:hypothetical protein
MEEERELRVLLLEAVEEDGELMAAELQRGGIKLTQKRVWTRDALLCDLGRTRAPGSGMAAPQFHKDCVAEDWIKYSRHSKPAP